MRMLMFHVKDYWYAPYDEDSDSSGTATRFEDCILVWVEAESKDIDDRTAVLRKMVKNIRWIAQKHRLRQVVLHSFAHLGGEKATPEEAQAIIEETATRLRTREYDVHIVHAGLNEFAMHVCGPSLAKVFKAF